MTGLPGFAAWGLAGLLVCTALLILRRPVAQLIRLILRSSVGLAALALFSQVGQALGVTLGVNLVNALVLGLLGVAVLITYSPQNGLILLVLAFLVSPYGLPLAAIWLLGKVQDLKFAIQDAVYR